MRHVVMALDVRSWWMEVVEVVLKKEERGEKEMATIPETITGALNLIDCLKKKYIYDLLHHC